MPIVILKGNQQTMYQIGKSHKPGGCPQHLTDEELKNHKDIVDRVLDEEVKKPVKSAKKVEDKKDLSFLEEMTKDELEKYVLDKHGIDLDKRKSLKKLVAKVKELEASK